MGINIAVLCSGAGTNLQALIDARDASQLSEGHLQLVVSSKWDVHALERARLNNIDTAVIARDEYADLRAQEEALIQLLASYHIDLIVLAGYLDILGSRILSMYEHRIINVHPSLIPSFCGKGFYGIKVHEAALAYGVKITGATVHLVNEIIDGGKIILQKSVDVRDDDTAEILQQRVMTEAEWILLPQAVRLFCEKGGFA